MSKCECAHTMRVGMVLVVRRRTYTTYINTMAECRSGRKCIAAKLNISDISRVFRDLLDDVIYQLPT